MIYDKNDFWRNIVLVWTPVVIFCLYSFMSIIKILFYPEITTLLNYSMATVFLAIIFSQPNLESLYWYAKKVIIPIVFFNFIFNLIILFRIV